MSLNKSVRELSSKVLGNWVMTIHWECISMLVGLGVVLLIMLFWVNTISLAWVTFKSIHFVNGLITLRYDLKFSCNTIPVISDRPQCRTRIKWDDSLCGDFRRSLIGRLTDFNAIVDQTDISDRNSINSCIETFTDVLSEASPLFSKTTYTNIENKPRLSANQVSKKADWFDEEFIRLSRLILLL